jgi:hypothetical protein
MPFVLVSAATAHPRVFPVLREGSKACRSEAALGRFHLRALSISAMFAVHSQGLQFANRQRFVRRLACCGSMAITHKFSVAQGSTFKNGVSQESHKNEQVRTSQ